MTKIPGSPKSQLSGHSLGVNSGEALVQAMKTGQLALQRARAMKTDPSVAWIEPRFFSCQKPPQTIRNRDHQEYIR